MLKHLSKKDNSQYVTHEDLKKLLALIMKQKGIKGDKGDSAYITDDIIDGIAKEVRPTKDELMKLIEPMIPDPIRGENGKDGTNFTDILPEHLVDTIRSVRGDKRLLIDDIRGGKKIIGKIIDHDNALQKINNNVGYLHEGYEEIGLFKDRIEAIEIIQKQPPCLPQEICETRPPTAADTAIPLSVWKDGSTGDVYQFICGLWTVIAKAADVVLPMITITAPTAGETLCDEINIIEVTASDDVDVQSVTYEIDGVTIGTSTVAPYSFEWDANDIEPGAKVITATVTDTSGNTESDTLTVIVEKCCHYVTEQGDIICTEQDQELCVEQGCE